MKSKWFLKPLKRLAQTRAVAGVTLVGALFVCVANVSAGVPDWLKAAARLSLPSYPDDPDAVVLFDEQETTVNDKGEIKTRHRRAYKILRPGGREHGTVGVYFDYETRLTYLKGWSIAAGGVEYEVKENEAIETSPFGVALYQDTRYKVLSIPVAEPGNVVGYEYEQQHRPFILQDTWWFQEEIPIRRARYVLELPGDWEFQSYWLNHSEQKPQSAGRTQWVWEVNDVPAVKRELSMPAWQAVAGRLAVAFYPTRQSLAGKSHGSWSDVGSWYAGLVAGRNQPTPEIKEEVKLITSDAATTLEKIKALATFAQKNVRYVAIEIGIGGYQPHPAQQVFANRYGDCKDKVTLLSAMLREIGVESYYVLIHSRRGVVVPEFPSGLSFNHAILAIKLPEEVPDSNLYPKLNHERLGRLLFFDPTDPFTPLGYLPPTLQASYGLLVTEDGGELLELPLLPPTANRLLRVGNMALSPEGNLSGAVQEIHWGEPAARVRAMMLDAPEAERKKVLESFLGNFLGSLVFQGSEVKNLENIDQTLVMQYRFLAKNYAKTAGNLLLVQPRVLGEKGSDLMEEKERKHPVEFRSATLHSDIFEITLPAGYEVDEIPQPVNLDVGFAEYSSEVGVEGNVLHYRRNYAINDIRVPFERLAELKEFFRQIAADERASAILKRVAP